MDILEIPFNQFIGLQVVNNNNDYILEISERPELLNHLGTMHASVLFALAEATSGLFLLQQFNNLDMELIPAVRKSEVKFTTPTNGKVFSKATLLGFDKQATIDELNDKNRTIIKVKVNLFNNSGKMVMTAFFDWFLTLTTF